MIKKYNFTIKKKNVINGGLLIVDGELSSEQLEISRLIDFLTTNPTDNKIFEKDINKLIEQNVVQKIIVTKYIKNFLSKSCRNLKGPSQYLEACWMHSSITSLLFSDFGKNIYPLSSILNYKAIRNIINSKHQDKNIWINALNYHRKIINQEDTSSLAKFDLRDFFYNSSNKEIRPDSPVMLRCVSSSSPFQKKGYPGVNAATESFFGKFLGVITNYNYCKIIELELPSMLYHNSESKLQTIISNNFDFDNKDLWGTLINHNGENINIEDLKKYPIIAIKYYNNKFKPYIPIRNEYNFGSEFKFKLGGAVIKNYNTSDGCSHIISGIFCNGVQYISDNESPEINKGQFQKVNWAGTLNENNYYSKPDNYTSGSCKFNISKENTYFRLYYWNMNFKGFNKTSVSEFIKQNYQVDDDPDIGQYKSFEIVRGGEHKNRYDNEAEMLQDKLETNNLDQVKMSLNKSYSYDLSFGKRLFNSPNGEELIELILTQYNIDGLKEYIDTFILDDYDLKANKGTLSTKEIISDLESLIDIKNHILLDKDFRKNIDTKQEIKIKESKKYKKKERQYLKIKTKEEKLIKERMKKKLDDLDLILQRTILNYESYGKILAKEDIKDKQMIKILLIDLEIINLMYYLRSNFKKHDKYFKISKIIIKKVPRSELRNAMNIPDQIELLKKKILENSEKLQIIDINKDKLNKLKIELNNLKKWKLPNYVEIDKIKDQVIIIDNFLSKLFYSMDPDKDSSLSEKVSELEEEFLSKKVYELEKYHFTIRKIKNKN